MEKFYINKPVAKGEKKLDKVEIFMSFLRSGKENAVKREDLTQKCVEAGLIKASGNKENEDRAMRKLLERAKVDYCITNDGDGAGYYRPTREEQKQLSKNNKREDKKAISTFRGIKVSKALDADLKAGRLDE